MRRYNHADNTWDALSNPTTHLAGVVFDRNSSVFYATTLNSKNGVTTQLWRSDPISSNMNENLKWNPVHEFSSLGIVNILSVGWGKNGAALYVQFQDYTVNVSFDGGKTWQSIDVP